MKKRFFIVTLILIVASSLMSQDKFLYVKSFTKKNSISIRMQPKNYTVFEIIQKNGLTVTRVELVNGVKLNKKIIFDNLKSKSFDDTASWKKYLKKNSKEASFVYSFLYNNKKDTINKNKLETSFGLLSLLFDYSSDASSNCGLLFKDTLIEKNKLYEYEFTVNNKGSKAALVVNSDILSENKKIVDFKATKRKYKKQTFYWNETDYLSHYSSYNIERSFDSINYKKINSSPIMNFNSDKNGGNISFQDTTILVKPKYFYRLKGINFFGEESEPSNVVMLKNYQDIKSFPNIDSIKTIQNKMVYLKWNMQDVKETPIIKKFILTRSDKDNGSYTNIYQNKTVLEFIDKAPLANNFYKVLAVTEYDDTLQSYSRMIYLNDTTAPRVPKNLKAIVDKKGNVTVTWSKNAESDLKGYRIFKANELHEEFVSTTDKFITDTVFKEKLPLNNLAHHLYYSITATDKNYNTSAQAKPFKLHRPDTIAPVKPIITTVKLNQNGVLLNFKPSKSEDVELHTLSRSSTNDKIQKTIFQFLVKDTSTTSFLDTSAVLGENYLYTLTAFDEDENKAMSLPRNVIFETGFRPKMKPLIAKVDLEKRKIYLNWEAYNKEVEKYILYRASESEPYIIIGTFEAKETSFTDKELSIGNIYSYKIKAVLKNGAESTFDKPIKVIY